MYTKRVQFLKTLVRRKDLENISHTIPVIARFVLNFGLSIQFIYVVLNFP